MKGDYLCKQGETGYCAFILFKGSVDVLANDGKTPVVSFKPGEMFGTKALDNNSLRSADLVATEKSFVFLLHKSSYSGIMGKYSKTEMQDNLQWLVTLEICKSMKRRQLRHFCSSLNSKYFEPNQVLIKQEEEIQNIYILKNGEVAASFWFPQEFVNEWPNSKVTSSKKVLKKSFRYQESLKAGDIIGLHSMLSEFQDQPHGTYKAVDKVHVLSISKETLVSLFPVEKQREIFFRRYLLEQKEAHEKREKSVKEEFVNFQKYVSIS